MLRIWGRMSSINVKKVVWAAQELALPFERLEAGGQFGVVKTPAYLAMNPNALVPVIDDGGFVLWESNAIVRYLCAKHSAGRLYPTDLPARFSAERWMDWQQTTANPAGREAFIQWVRTPPDKRNQGAIDKSCAAMSPLLDLLESCLAQSPFIAGPAFTMADIPIALEIQRWFGLPQPRAAYPRIEAWYAQMLARPASRGVLDLPLS
jgi:glutathione S-transferase